MHEGSTAGRLRPSAVALVLANTVPLAGVLLWQWSISSVVILYWFENVVIGVLNVARMIALSPSRAGLAAAIAGGNEARAAVVEEATRRAFGQIGGSSVVHGLKFFLVPFFTLHYFMFCAGHGVFVFSMFGDEDGYFSDVSGIDFLGSLGRAIEIFSTPLALAAAALLLSHAFSFVQNYLIGGEFRRLDLKRLMVMPYGRIIALHITIIAGGFLTMLAGEPLWMLLILVAVKTLVDYRMHLKEHGAAA